MSNDEYPPIEFHDDLQDFDPPPAYELVAPVFYNMALCPTRYGLTRTAFVQALIPFSELLLHDVDDDLLLDLRDRDPVYEELIGLFLEPDGDTEKENDQRPDTAWAAAVVAATVAYTISRRNLAIEVMCEVAEESEPGTMVS
jgi:hypothetical protein